MLFECSLNEKGRRMAPGSHPPLKLKKEAATDHANLPARARGMLEGSACSEKRTQTATSSVTKCKKRPDQPLTWSMKQTKSLQKEETSKRQARAFGNKAPKARPCAARRQMLKTEASTTFWFVNGAAVTALFIKSAKWGPIGPSSPPLTRRKIESRTRH